MANPAENPDTSAELDAQLLAFGDDQGDDSPLEFGQTESNEGQSQENERRFIGWNDVLPDDPNLPDTYRGKKTFGDVWQERTDVIHKINRANQLLNERDAELRTQRATIDLLTQRVGQPAQATQPQPTFTDVTGVDFDRELLTDPNGAMGRFANHLEEKLDSKVTAKVSRQIEELQTKLRNAEAKEFMDSMANASYSAANSLGVPKEQWDARVRDMMSSIWKEANDIRAFRDPRWWQWAHDDAAQRWGYSQQAAAVSQGNPGTNTRSAGIRQSGKALPDRYVKLAAQYAADFGLDPKLIEAEIAKDFASGKVR